MPRAAGFRRSMTPDSQSPYRVKRASTAATLKTGETGGNPPVPDPTKRLAYDELANLLVGYRLDATLNALADPTRRAMLARLAAGEKPAAQLARGFAMSDTAAAKHLAVLEAAGLVRRCGEGRGSLRAFDGDPLVEAILWLRRWQRFASPRSRRIAAILAAAEGEE